MFFFLFSFLKKGNKPTCTRSLKCKKWNDEVEGGLVEGVGAVNFELQDYKRPKRVMIDENIFLVLGGVCLSILWTRNLQHNNTKSYSYTNVIIWWRQVSILVKCLHPLIALNKPTLISRFFDWSKSAVWWRPSKKLIQFDPYWTVVDNS